MRPLLFLAFLAPPHSLAGKTVDLRREDDERAPAADNEGKKNAT